MRFSACALVVRVALAVALAALAWRAGDVLQAASDAIGFTLSLDYGEGIVLQQALLVTGPRAYGDITRYPFIVFHYPPGFLLASRAVAALGVDLVAAGRLVSYAATLAMAAAIGTMAHATLAGAPREARLFGAAVAALLLFSFWPVALWMPLARVDMLAYAFTLWGLVLALRAPESHWRAFAAAAMFTAAMFTRQTTFAAPLAATLVLLLASPRDATRLVLGGLVLSLALLSLATLLTGGGFLQHLVLHNINRYDHRGFWTLYYFVVESVGPIGLGFGGALLVLWLLLPRLRRLPTALRAEPAARAAAAALIYTGISTPLLLLVAKSGANVNYFIEWASGCATLGGMLVGRIAQSGLARGAGCATAAGAALLAAVLTTHAATVRTPAHGVLTDFSLTFMQDLVALARKADRTIISDDMVLTLRAGKEVPWESAIFAELGGLGRWDERLIVDMIREGRFAFAVTVGDRGSPIFDSRYSFAVLEALEEAFPVRIRRGRLIIRLPANSDWTPLP